MSWYEDWAEWARVRKTCLHCGRDFTPKSPTHKYCTREDNPACDDDRWLEKLWQKGKHPLQVSCPELKERQIIINP